MERQEIHLMFYIKRTKLKKDGTAPIFLKVTLGYKKAETSLRRSIEPEKWNNQKNRVIGTSKEAKSINTYIDAITFKVHELVVNALEQETEVNINSVLKIITGTNSDEKTLLYAMDYHNEQMKALIGREYAKSTYDKYIYTTNYFKEFISSKYDKEDINLKKIDHRFISDFEFFLRTEKMNSTNSAAKHLKNFKKVMGVCVSNKWIKENPFFNYKIKLEKTDRGFLTEEELQKIIQKKIPIRRVDNVRDCFLFACFTGLAYSDLVNLKKENIVTGNDGEKWIVIHRKKTNERSPIPLLYITKQILEKYSDDPICQIKNKLLPIYSNQKLNSYLVEVADICGINKKITMHVARHTFATTVTLNNDVPIESVSKMLGHTSLSTTKIYARLMDKKIGRDMSGIIGKYELGG
jgi:site-specific recombinase XerD